MWVLIFPALYDDLTDRAKLLFLESPQDLIASFALHKLLTTVSALKVSLYLREKYPKVAILRNLFKIELKISGAGYLQELRRIQIQ